jgi:hypothetical protein
VEQNLNGMTLNSPRSVRNQVLSDKNGAQVLGENKPVCHQSNIGVFELIEVSHRNCYRGDTTRDGYIASVSGQRPHGGKVHQFVVYFERNLFDTPENRVITSGLTFGFRLTQVFGSSNPSKTGL